MMEESRHGSNLMDQPSQPKSPLSISLSFLGLFFISRLHPPNCATWCSSITKAPRNFATYRNSSMAMTPGFVQMCK